MPASRPLPPRLHTARPRAADHGGPPGRPADQPDPRPCPHPRASPAPTPCQPPQAPPQATRKGWPYYTRERGGMSYIVGPPLAGGLGGGGLGRWWRGRWRWWCPGVLWWWPV